MSSVGDKEEVLRVLTVILDYCLDMPRKGGNFWSHQSALNAGTGTACALFHRALSGERKQPQGVF